MDFAKPIESLKKLDIFDFDGTLVNTPCDTPENLKKFEKFTGVPWLVDRVKSKELSEKLGRHIGIRRGWWGRPESLEPPLVPDPTPQNLLIPEALKAWVESRKNVQSQTVLMTGRHYSMRPQLLRICGDLGLLSVQYAKQGTKYNYLDRHYWFSDKDVQLYMLGDMGPDGSRRDTPSTTLEWKVWIMKQFVDILPDLEEIEIWEDREPHVQHFQSLSDVFGVPVHVNFIKTERSS